MNATDSESVVVGGTQYLTAKVLHATFFNTSSFSSCSFSPFKSSITF